MDTAGDEFDEFNASTVLNNMLENQNKKSTKNRLRCPDIPKPPTHITAPVYKKSNIEDA